MAILLPTSSVRISPTLYSTRPLVFKCVGIKISESFSGNLPDTKLIDKFVKAFDSKALIKAYGLLLFFDSSSLA